MYNDNYESCSETYVTLRIYIENMSSEKITEYLVLEPTRSKNADNEIKFNRWFLSSKGEINSKDCRRHLDYLLDRILPLKDKIKELINDGATIDLSCYWLSKNGSGGPTLSASQFGKLAEIGIDLWFDVY